MNIECEIYNPRWGHTDIYKFSFEENKLIISASARTCSLIWRDNLDPKWQGDLYGILENDSIYPPKVLKGCISKVWESWRKNELLDSEAETELNLLIEWLNTITNSKPRSDFWRMYF